MRTDLDTDAGPGIHPLKMVTVVGIGPRLVARLIDTILLGFLSIVVAAAGGIIGELIGMYSANVSAWGAFFTFGAGLVFSLAYYVAAWAKDGQTLGDTLLGLKVVTANGSSPSMGQAVVRYLGYLVSALALSLGFVWIAIDSKRQGWHDKLARTYVIPSQQNFSVEDRVSFVPADRRAGRVWIGAWILLVLFAPGVLLGALLSLGPFVDAIIKSVRAA